MKKDNIAYNPEAYIVYTAKVREENCNKPRQHDCVKYLRNFYTFKLKKKKCSSH